MEKGFIPKYIAGQFLEHALDSEGDGPEAEAHRNAAIHMQKMYRLKAEPIAREPRQVFPESVLENWLEHALEQDELVKDGIGAIEFEARREAGRLLKRAWDNEGESPLLR